MRRAATLVLALIAAFAAPVRQACGSTCVDAAPPPVHELAASAEHCHKTEAPPPEPEPAPSHERCTHDHNASLNAAPRYAITASDAQPALLPALTAFEPVHSHTAVIATRSEIPPGSPPIRFVALRI